MIDDVELLRRYARDSSQDAFAELVRRHIDLVYSAALPRVGHDSHLAEDITQRVFSDLAQRAGSLAIHSSLAGWLYTRARFMATDAVRGEQRRRLREEEAELMNERSVNPPGAAGWESLRPVLAEAVDQLKPEDRDAVLLRFFELRPLVEIGVHLRISEDAAQKRVARSLDKLRLALARRGVTSTTAALSLALADQVATAAPAGLATSVTGAALASVGAVATPALSLLQIMSTTKIASLAALAMLVAALGVDTYEVRAHRAAEAALAASSANYEALLAKLHTIQESTRIAAQNEARRKQAVAIAQAASVANSRSGDSVAAGKAYLLRHPEVRQALIARSRALTNFNFGSLYKTLGLTPGQISQFQTLMMERGGVSFTTNGSQYVTVSAGTGLSPDEVQNQLSDLLGPDGLAQFRQLSQTQRPRMLTAEAASALAFTGSPLTAAQSDQLVQILTDNRTRGQFNWDPIIAQAQPVMTTPQLAVLTGLKAEDAEQALYQVGPLSDRPGAGAPPTR